VLYQPVHELLCGGGTSEELQRAGCVALYQDPADLLAHMAGRFWTSRGQQKFVLTEKPAWRGPSRVPCCGNDL